MLSAHTRQSSKQVLTVLYLLSTYSIPGLTYYFISLGIVLVVSYNYTAEDVEPAIVRRRLLL